MLLWFCVCGTESQWFYCGVASDVKETIGFTAVLLRRQRKPQVLRGFGVGCTENHEVPLWFSLGGIANPWFYSGIALGVKKTSCFTAF